MAGKLTKRRVDAAKTGETLWDGEIRGLGLRVFASGARSYVFKYRRSGVQRWHTIGLHGSPWTPETARKEALRLKRIVDQGGDPAADKAEERNAETLTAFSERYLEDYARPHKKIASVAQDERNLKIHILPALGRLRVKDIQRADIARFHLALKHKPYAANRCLALLSHMFKMAGRWGVRPENSNPCTHVDKYREKGRERFLSPKELKRLGRALAVVERAGKAPYVVAAIRLLLFTGARLSEILELRWEYVDMSARVIRLPDSKTGAKTIALSAPAVEVLSTLPREQGNPLVICGQKRRAGRQRKGVPPRLNLHHGWRRIRKAALIEDVRLHDLRHSFASVAVAGGMSLPLIGSLLGHAQPQTTHRYAHLAEDPRRAAADAVASAIEASMNGIEAAVVPLRSGLRD